MINPYFTFTAGNKNFCCYKTSSIIYISFYTDPNEKYKCGARDKRMLKVKMFQDDEFEITGMTDGLREEDFVFNMKTKDGYPFEAKPMGDRALKK